jgi:uncharacterized protein (DUF305 family)
MLPLENQSAAMAGLVAQRSTTPQVRQLGTHLSEHADDAADMRRWMRDWHQPAPPSYSPGANPYPRHGPGMMDSRDWDEMARHHGRAFDTDWIDAMIRHHTAEIALCRTELRSGTNLQATTLAETILSDRQAELARMRSLQSHTDDHGD